MTMNALSEVILRRLFKRETRQLLTLLSQVKLLLAFGERRPYVEPINDFSDKKVLVLAPHMDDEVLGCGGTLRKHVLAGGFLTVVYLTDGRRGKPELYNRGLSKKEVAREEEELVSRRKEEAAKAAKIVGIQELLFLDYPDGDLNSCPHAAAQLTRILEERRPSVIYFPSIFDLHTDHWATNLILYETTKRLVFSKDWRPTYRAYEVWSALLVANRIVDITDIIELKQAAAREFATQMNHTDFIRTIVGLNAYRSLYYLRGRGFAEAFHESSPELYKSLVQSFQGQMSPQWGLGEPTVDPNCNN